MKARMARAAAVAGVVAAMFVAPAASAGETGCASVRALVGSDDWSYRASAVLRAAPVVCVDAEGAGERAVDDVQDALRWYR